MRLLNLFVQNIGPFDQAQMEFLLGTEPEVPVAIITGENGTGKTILLDAIRGLFGPEYAALERAIWRPNTPFQVRATLMIDDVQQVIRANQAHVSSNKLYALLSSDGAFRHFPSEIQRVSTSCPNWIVDFWRSSLPADSYAITHLALPDPKHFLVNSLKGIQRNAAVTELICGFDYLRGSDNPRDRRDGEVLYDTIRRIVEASLLDGELSHVDRRAFMPMFRQSGQLVSLANLSSGNAYLVQHLIGLLWKMYAVHMLRETDAADLCNTPGLLLIDEAEHHLHPRWQKRFLLDVLRIFPNLQIIATTHSPFIVASIPGARVFVCRYERDRKSCVVEDATDVYANKPIEEILVSPAFDGTLPFGNEITELLEQRNAAMAKGDEAKRQSIEAQLKDKNPEYFSYLEIDEHLRALRGEGR